MSRFGLESLSRVEAAVDRTIRMARVLPTDVAGREIGRQVVRSAGSVGANLQEAQAVLTRKDFVHRVSLPLREARETLYWMRRIQNNDLVSPDRLVELVAEWNELVAILTSIVRKVRVVAEASDEGSAPEHDYS